MECKRSSPIRRFVAKAALLSAPALNSDPIHAKNGRAFSCSFAIDESQAPEVELQVSFSSRTSSPSNSCFQPAVLEDSSVIVFRHPACSGEIPWAFRTLPRAQSSHTADAKRGQPTFLAHQKDRPKTRNPTTTCYLNSGNVTMNRFAISVIAAMLAVPSVATGESVALQIITAIEKPDCLDGMKSTQNIKVNTDTRSVATSHVTGTTDILGCELPSIKDRFVIEKLAGSATDFNFKAIGQTATAASLGLGGEIDYQIVFHFNTEKKTVTITGKHDGYPTYYIKLNGKDFYKFEQTNLAALLGDSEIEISPTTLGY